MMDKIKIFFLVLVVIIISGIGIFYYLGNLEELAIEKTIPQGAWGYICIKNVEKNLKEFKSTELWQRLKEINIKKLMEKSGFSGEEINRYSQIKVNLWLLRKFFNKEIAVAIYLQRETVVSNKIADVVLVTRISPGAEVFQYLSELVKVMGGKCKIKKFEKYKGYKLVAVEVPEKLIFWYVKIKDLLIFSMNKRRLFSCIDVVKGEAEPLFCDIHYALTKRKLGLNVPPQIFMYGNGKLFFAQMESYFRKTAEKLKVFPPEKWDKLFQQGKVFKTVGCAIVPKQKILQGKIIVLFDKKNVPLVVKMMSSSPPQKSRTLRFMPKRVIAYEESNWDIGVYWEDWIKRLSFLGEEEILTTFVTEIEEELGISIREVILALGKERGFALVEGEGIGRFPFLEFLYFTEVRNKSVVEKALKNIVEKNNLLMQTDNYKGIDIRYLLLDLDLKESPAYCYLDNYLLLSTSRRVLNLCIDAFYNQKLSLLWDEKFRSVDFGLTEENHRISFLKMDKLVKKIRLICEWVSRWGYLMERIETGYKEAERDYVDKGREEKKGTDNGINIEVDESTKQERGIPIKFYLEEVVYPLLKVLQSNKAIGTRTLFNQEYVEFYFFSKIE